MAIFTQNTTVLATETLRNNAKIQPQLYSNCGCIFFKSLWNQIGIGMFQE